MGSWRNGVLYLPLGTIPGEYFIFGIGTPCCTQSVHRPSAALSEPENELPNALIMPWLFGLLTTTVTPATTTSAMPISKILPNCMLHPLHFAECSKQRWPVC